VSSPQDIDAEVFATSALFVLGIRLAVVVEEVQLPRARRTD